MLAFMYQIQRQRTKAQAKRATRCQLSSCQGNEREMWRRGQTPMYSKRSAELFVKKSKHLVIFFFFVWSKYASLHCAVYVQSYVFIFNWPTMCPFNFAGKASTSKWKMTSAGEWLLGFCLDIAPVREDGKKNVFSFLIPLLSGLKARISRSKWNASGKTIFMSNYCTIHVKKSLLGSDCSHDFHNLK